MLKNAFIYILLVLLAYTSPGQDDTASYFDPGYLRYADWTYDSCIYSVELYKEGNVLSWPVIQLGSGEDLVLSFDDLCYEFRSFRYTFIHCDALWQPSDLRPLEYLQGFKEGEITGYRPSLNTIQPYTHYSEVITGQGMQPMLSGNYLLKVYPADQPEQPVFTRRFMVLEEGVSISGNVRFATDVDKRNYYQEVRFSIDRENIYIANPYEDLRVIVRQNGHWDAAITGLKPRMVRDNILDYEYDRGNYFSGGNEFRHFDTKSFKYFSENVRTHYRDMDGYHVILFPDQRRTFLVYRSDEDINGRLLYTSEEMNDPAIESEYAWVEFTLPYDVPLFHGSIYVFGQLTDWQYLPRARMEYDFGLKAYTCKLYLKQGYFNYQYVFLPNTGGAADESFIEGRHAETENEYYIFVYYRPSGAQYDKLIGYKAMNSIR